MTRITPEPRDPDESLTANEAGNPPSTSPAKQGDGPRHTIGRFLGGGSRSGSALATAEATERNGQMTADAVSEVPKRSPEDRPPIAVFCHEPPDSYIGGHVAQAVPALARRGRTVHLFSRYPFAIDEPRVRVHVVGPGNGSGTGTGPEPVDLLEQVGEFNRRAGNAFMQAFAANEPVAVLGYEWTSAQVLSLLKGLRNLPGVLSLHTLERQRSDLSSDISRKILAIEAEALQNASTLYVHEHATIEVARQWIPTCFERIVHARLLFPMANFESDLDPGAVKARYQVGPVDPMILFVGDLDERYGPDLLIKAMPALLRHHPQARLVIVGEGHLFWPMRVFTRYLLLEHAVRLVGHVVDRPMYDLVQAADLVAVPSREATPWWPIQAAWAARKPVVATHEAARTLTDHEKDSVLVYPSENSVVWGVERVLYDPELRQAIGKAGRQKLEERFGWNRSAEDLESVLDALVTNG